MKKILIIGYGNMDRQDDGVAWHILNNIGENFGVSIINEGYELINNTSAKLSIFYSLQLLPEMAEFINQYDTVYFVDAHTGEYEEEILYSEIHPQALNSPFTHHLTPEMLLSICLTIFNNYPRSYILSVKGHEFGFNHDLSNLTQALAEQASAILINKILQVNID